MATESELHCCASPCCESFMLRFAYKIYPNRRQMDYCSEGRWHTTVGTWRWVVLGDHRCSDPSLLKSVHETFRHHCNLVLDLLNASRDTEAFRNYVFDTDGSVHLRQWLRETEQDASGDVELRALDT